MTSEAIYTRAFDQYNIYLTNTFEHLANKIVIFFLI